MPGAPRNHCIRDEYIATMKALTGSASDSGWWWGGTSLQLGFSGASSKSLSGPTSLPLLWLGADS